MRSRRLMAGEAPRVEELLEPSQWSIHETETECERDMCDEERAAACGK